MEIYVNKIPKNCGDCNFKNIEWCVLQSKCDCLFYQNIKCPTCPLKSITEVQNKKAVEALEKLKQDIWVDQYDDGYLDKQVDIYYLTEEIDQLIKEYGGKDE